MDFWPLRSCWVNRLTNLLTLLAASCEPGQYLDVNSPSQDCKACEAGHYSLGGDVIYTNWTTIPSGFETRSFDDSYNQWSGKKKGNCTKYAEF